jgi:hypothetical protein
MDNPEVLVYVRVAYVASQVIILGMYYYVSLQVIILSARAAAFAHQLCDEQVKKKNDTTVLKYG